MGSPISPASADIFLEWFRRHGAQNGSRNPNCPVETCQRRISHRLKSGTPTGEVGVLLYNGKVTRGPNFGLSINHVGETDTGVQAEMMKEISAQLWMFISDDAATPCWDGFPLRNRVFGTSWRERRSWCGRSTTH